MFWTKPSKHETILPTKTYFPITQLFLARAKFCSNVAAIVKKNVFLIELVVLCKDFRVFAFYFDKTDCLLETFVRGKNAVCKYVVVGTF